MFYPWEYAPSVFAIDYERLYEYGLRGLIFDVDNTLVHHNDDSTPEVDELFRRLYRIGFKTVLLSDNEKSRMERFVKNIDTPYICDADKPSPEGYKKALAVLKMKKAKTVCIGDQMFVDIIGANRLAIPNILVHYITVPGETKIGKKRYIEKLILKIYSHRKKYTHRLGAKSRSPTPSAYRKRGIISARRVRYTVFFIRYRGNKQTAQSSLRIKSTGCFVLKQISFATSEYKKCCYSVSLLSVWCFFASVRFCCFPFL